MVRFIGHNDVKSILELAIDYYHTENNPVANYFRLVRRHKACVSVDEQGHIAGFILLCQAVFLIDEAEQCDCWFVFKEYCKNGDTKDLHSFAKTNIAEPIIYVPSHFADYDKTTYHKFATRKLCILEKSECETAKLPFSSLSAKQLVTYRKKVMSQKTLLWGYDVAQLLVESYKHNNMMPYLIGSGENKCLIICKKESEILTIYEFLSEKNVAQAVMKVADAVMAYFGVGKALFYLHSNTQLDASVQQYAFVNTNMIPFSTDNYVFIE